MRAPGERNSAREEMTGSAPSGNLNRGPRISLALHPGYTTWIIANLDHRKLGSLNLSNPGKPEFDLVRFSAIFW
jgi:hypothetical protein